MKFTVSWLKEHLETDASVEEIAEKLTAIGLEVEEVVDNSEVLAPFTVAEILEAEKHPNADKLKLCKVNSGKEELQIVCGAPNARAGLKVVLASVGTVIPNGGFKIKKSKIRDVESNGMLCSAAELNLGEDAAGIIELPENAKIGDPAANYLGGDDPMIEIAITPNRGDCLGVFGIARDLAAAGLGKLKPEKVTTEDFQEVVDQGKFDSPINVTIESDKATFFVGRYFKGVKNGESPAWLKQRLESIGLKPISALVDITNFLTFDQGRPAHVFDAKKLNGNITLREAKKNEKLQALDEKIYSLDKDTVVIADEKNPVALGGIIGGLDSGCTEETTDVFLEIALFDPIAIATTGRKLQIDSDARYRFERGVSPFTLKHFITATDLILELCGGEESKPVIAGSIPMDRHTIEFDPKDVENLIGITPNEKEITSILEKLGFKISSKKSSLELGVPSWRPDVTESADVVEEIARIHGYDAIPDTPMPPAKQGGTILTPLQTRVAAMRRNLASRGMQEAVTYSFVDSKSAACFGASNDNLRLENPISSELDMMRPTILPGLLAAVQRNEARGSSDIALFEIGSSFSDLSEEGQANIAAGVRNGEANPKHVQDDGRTVDLFDAKADAMAALSHFIPPEKLTITQGAPEWYHPGRSGTLALGKATLGYFGELHPGVLNALDVKGPAVGFEVFYENAPEPKAKRSNARPKLELSNYQAVDRDFAFLVDDTVAAGDIERAVRQVEKNLIQDVRIFDVYSGKGVEDGKKSVALTVRLQPADRTLTDAEIDSVSKAIISNVEKTTGGSLRG